MGLYLYLCTIIFLLFMVKGVFDVAFYRESFFYEGNPFTSTSFWLIVVGFSCPFLNIFTTGVFLYYYITVRESLE